MPKNGGKQFEFKSFFSSVCSVVVLSEREKETEKSSQKQSEKDRTIEYLFHESEVEWDREKGTQKFEQIEENT